MSTKIGLGRILTSSSTTIDVQDIPGNERMTARVFFEPVNRKAKRAKEKRMKKLTNMYTKGN